MTASAVIPIKYEWKPGARVKASPDQAAYVFGKIERKLGSVQPAAVVEASRAPDSPLHGEFEWDDTKAGEAYRIDQARRIIRSLVVIHVDRSTEEKLPAIRAYVKVDEPERADEPERSYQPIVKVMSNGDVRERYVRQAFGELLRWRERYQDIDDFARIFREVDELRAKLGG